jgi:hypothetical protein
MSHTTRRRSAIKDLPTLKKAVDRIPGAEYLGYGEAKRYGKSSHGHNVKLPGWRYPVSFDINTGECTFDNYGGRWGKECDLDALKQGYAVEAAKAKAQAEDRPVEEIKLDDGSIKLVIPLGGDEYAVEGGAGGGDGWDV